MQVMILAAGRSTRLGGLGELLPKPLVPICGYPAIAFGLALCRHAGLTDVVVNLHHRGDLVREALGDGERYGVRIRYSPEEQLLGTGGGLAHARGLFQPGPVLVMNAKTVAEVDLLEVLAVHRAAPAGSVATMVLTEGSVAERASPVGVDLTGRVISLRGQRTDRTPVGPIAERTFTGIHVVEPALLDRLPSGGVSDLVADAYLPALLAGARINSLTIRGYFADPSSAERYLETNRALLRNPALLACAPGPLVGIDGGAAVDSSARVLMPSRVAAGAVVEANATIGPETVVCAGARVKAGARITQSVVWADAVAEGEMHLAVVPAVPEK